MIRRMMGAIVGAALILIAAIIGITWFAFRIYVPEDKCLVLIKKSGNPLPSGQLVAENDSQRGIQKETLGPGRYFRNPISWDYELVDLVKVSSGDPKTWQWDPTLDPIHRGQIQSDSIVFGGTFPEVAVVTRNIGQEPPEGAVVVAQDSPYKGVLREVLTPGTYRLNPYVYKVQKYPATVIPTGYVGVVINQIGEDGNGEPAVSTEPQPTTSYVTYDSSARLAEPGARGIQKEVLPPGIYFINPKEKKIVILEIGFNELSQLSTDKTVEQLSFPSDTGYEIVLSVTVVWGIHPKHAPEIINEFGNMDAVREKVILPQLRSICRNRGSQFAARDFIQGERREEFQKEATKDLETICRVKNIEILIFLVHDIEVRQPGGSPTGPDTDLKRTIQQSYISIEQQITNDKLREAATVKAQLEEAQKKVDVARENIEGDTRVKVATILAEGEKEAAEIQAQTRLDVASIQQQIAVLDAQKTEIIGRAHADVEKLKNQAEADGFKLLVDAFGSGQAYNLYTFAQDFSPRAIRLIFAGEGTLWTDLNRLEQVGATKLLQEKK